MFYLLTPVPLICFIRSDAVLVELKVVHSVNSVGTEKCKKLCQRLCLCMNPTFFY